MFLILRIRSFCYFSLAFIDFANIQLNIWHFDIFSESIKDTVKNKDTKEDLA